MERNNNIRPIRKFEIFNRSMDAPETPINDDEEERKAGREQAVHDESKISNLSESIIKSDEGVKTGLRFFSENKINKLNAWSMSLIDDFSTLISRHHKCTNNFQMAGTTLEASGKIYGLRVDSVHTDAVHIATGLTRLKNKPQNDNGNDDGDIGENNGGGDSDDETNTSKTNGTPTTQVKKTKRRKFISTITKNKESIDLKFETNTVQEPIFTKINSTIGDINSSHRLLTYILSTVNSELIHRTDLPFWDSKDVEPIEQNAVPTKAYEYNKMKLIDLPISLNITRDNILRPHQSGYHISDTPADEEPTEEQPIIEDYDVDMAFDLNAEIMPIETESICFDIVLNTDGYGELNKDNIEAISQCKGLEREHTVIKDLRPIDSVNLEYSYRPLEGIDRFWAGPSHWKFRKTTTASSTASGSTIAGPVPKRRGYGRRKLNKKEEPIKFVDDFDDSVFISVDSIEVSKLKKVDTSKWDPRKLKLPTNHNLDLQMFNHYQFAPNLPMNWNNLADDEQDISMNNTVVNTNNISDAQNQGNVSMNCDGDDHFGDIAVNNVFDHGINNDDGVINNNNDPNTQINLACNETVQEIGTEFVGAPEKVEKIIIHFARRAKVIDMKQMKRCCLAIVDKQRHITKENSFTTNATTTQQLGEDYEVGVATFYRVYSFLPNILTQNMKEALSPAIALYTILHLANEYHFRLQLIDREEDFSIRKIVANEELSEQQVVPHKPM